MKNARQNLLDIAENPDRHQDHAKRYVSWMLYGIYSVRKSPIRYAVAVVMGLAYGKVPPSFEDPEVQAVNRCLTTLGLTMRTGAWKVDILPLLKRVLNYIASCIPLLTPLV